MGALEVELLCVTETLLLVLFTEDDAAATEDEL
jgi:hypothetical protein